MTLRTVGNDRLVDGAKIDNLPSDVNASLALKEDKESKGVAGGYASLDGSGKVPASQLPGGRGTGDVTGPSSSADNAIVRFDGTGGKTIQNSSVSIDDSNNVSVPGEVYASDTDGAVALRKMVLHASPTGVHDGCNLSSSSPTSFTISSGTIQKVDPSTHPHTYTEYTFAGGTFSNSYLSSPFTYILLGTDGNVYQQDTEPTISNFTDKAYIGVTANSGGAQIAIASRMMSTSSLGNQIQEYFRIVGALNVRGQIKATANGANTSLNTSAGTIWRLGANYDNSTSFPNSAAITAKTPLSFVQYYVNGSGTLVPGSLVTTMDTSNYNNGGTLATLATNRWVNHQLYMSPNGFGLMLYGSTTYGSLDLAKAGRATETFNVPALLASQATVAWVTVKGQTTDLSNATNNDIFSVSSFTAGGGGGGGSGSGDMLAATYDPAGIAQQLVGTTAPQSLSNKAISLGSNTVSGTLAQFNTACTDADFASIAGAEALTNKSVNGVTLSTSAGATNFLAGDGSYKAVSGVGSMQLDPSLSADGKWSGITETGTAGAALTFGQLCYFAAEDSRWELAKADSATTSGSLKLGMCVLAAAGDGSATEMLLIGKVRADAQFPTLTIGSPAYISSATAGAIVTAQPTATDHVIRVIGYANSADELFFNPSADYFTHT